MSIITCDGCGAYVDTDFDPASYDEKTDEWLCDICRETLDIQEELFGTKPTDAHFNGPEYKPDRDHVRLRGQILRVFNCMSDGKWRTLDQISKATGDPHASVSAQLRHLRKPRFGSYEVDRRHIKNGLFEYKLHPDYEGDAMKDAGRLDDCWRDEDEWQDISTAPKDAKVLAWYPTSGEVVILDTRFKTAWGMNAASHWMNLPKPPKESK